MAEESVILVDKKDHQIGLMEKMQAHREGRLHRAFSVFVFNNQGMLMLQKRAFHKYHSPGLWSNTCCSHPRNGETVEQAAHRRLMEEMGFDCRLEHPFHFIYKADVGQGLTEHELDHVFIGYFDGNPQVNSDEVADWMFVNLDELQDEMKTSPEKYTIWFNIIFGKVIDFLNSKN